MDVKGELKKILRKAINTVTKHSKPNCNTYHSTQTAPFEHDDRLIPINDILIFGRSPDVEVASDGEMYISRLHRIFVPLEDGVLQTKLIKNQIVNFI